MKSVRKLFNKINISGEILFDEPLSSHSTFKIGGKADIYIKAASSEDIIKIKKIADSENIPLYPLGEGANILFSDNGYRGIILDTSLLDSIEVMNGSSVFGADSVSAAPELQHDLNAGIWNNNKENVFVKASAGVKISSLAETCTEKGLEGLENFYGMPGFVGGSVFMNARCYGVSLSERIKNVFYIDSNYEKKQYIYSKDDFDYKKSPFQNKNVIILEALFSLKKSLNPDLLDIMHSFKEEREAKGHYMYPCAGSVFKNNREFGEPTGKIIDRLGLRGFSVGGAMISEKHANIIVNTGNATEKDIKKLINFVSRRVYDSCGFSLEREVIYVDEGEQ